MEYLELFFGFLKVGLFAFGGGYGSIPLIREVVLQYGWLTEEELTYLIAVSESTPGSIMVNLATYVGSEQGGFLGAVAATFGVVLPAFLIILLLTALLKSALSNRYVQTFLGGIKPGIIGIVLATGVVMVLGNCVVEGETFGLDVKALALTVVLAGSVIGYAKIVKKNLSPILLIIISAVLGAVVYA